MAGQVEADEVRPTCARACRSTSAFVFLAGAARGYLGRADGERFDLGRPARMYRTGDLGRCRADGPLEFLGQVGPNQVQELLAFSHATDVG